MQVLSRAEWEPRALAHAERVEQWIRPHLERRGARVPHPVHDFLFTYYSQRPAQLQFGHAHVQPEQHPADAVSGHEDG